MSLHARTDLWKALLEPSAERLEGAVAALEEFLAGLLDTPLDQTAAADLAGELRRAQLLLEQARSYYLHQLEQAAGGAYYGAEGTVLPRVAAGLSTQG